MAQLMLLLVKASQHLEIVFQAHFELMLVHSKVVGSLTAQRPANPSLWRLFRRSDVCSPKTVL